MAVVGECRFGGAGVDTPEPESRPQHFVGNKNKRSHPWASGGLYRGTFTGFRYQSEVVVDVERLCKTCGVVKPIGEFYRSSSFWYRGSCKACVIARQVARARASSSLRPRDRSAEYAKRRRLRRAAAAAAGCTAQRHWWTVVRVCAETGLSTRQVRFLSRRGVLVADWDTSGTWRYDPRSVLAFVESWDGSPLPGYPVFPRHLFTPDTAAIVRARRRAVNLQDGCDAPFSWPLASEAQSILGISRSAFSRYARSGQLTRRRDADRRWRYDPDSLAAFVPARPPRRRS